MSEMSEELPFPEWQGPLQEVILECDRDKLAVNAQHAESLILERLRQLQQSNNGHRERDAIDHGLSLLRSIRRERLDGKAHESMENSAEANRHSVFDRCS